MKNIEFKVTIAVADDTAVAEEVIKQALEDAMLALACDRNMCYEVACTHAGKLEQDPLIPFTREVPVDKKQYKWFNSPYDPLYVANSLINSNAPQEEQNGH